MARILQTVVPLLLPEEGPIDVLLVGEAPGPRGADQSGIPFWGDRAGVAVYRALEASDRAVVPPAAYECWDGARFRDLGLKPRLRRTALGNAYPQCPTRDGHSFRAPSDRELLGADNILRWEGELEKLLQRAAGPLKVLTLGRRAAFLFERFQAGRNLVLHALPHPSAQGLLQAAPNQGKGLKLVDLREAWEATLRGLL